MANGLKSVIVTSASEGEGRTVTAIGIALAAASNGKRVALVDGDIENPTLQHDLQLDLDSGWVEAIRGGLLLDDVAVHSIHDNLTLIPLLAAGSEGFKKASATDLVRMVDQLDGKFDLIVIDGSTSSTTSVHNFATLVDTAVIVRNKNTTDLDTVNELAYRLRESGVTGIGIVENFS